MTDPKFGGPRPTINTMIRIGVLTPHGVPGPEVEFAAMAPGRLATRVVRVTADASGRPPSAAALDELTAAAAAPILERAAGQLLTGPVDVIGYASTTSAYTIGFDAEMTMTSRLSQLTGRPVAASCASAVQALRVLQLERVALILRINGGSGQKNRDDGANEEGFHGMSAPVLHQGLVTCHLAGADAR